MKKINFMILAAFLISANNIFAQDSDEDKKRPHIGVKAGINLSNVWDSEDDDFESDSKIGLVAGGFLSIPLLDYVAFQPELLFSQKGYIGRGSFLGAKYEMTRTSNFIDVPLLLALKTSDRLTIVIGPQYSFLISQSNNFTSGNFSVENKEEFDNEDIRKNTLCILGGFDVNFEQLVVGARGGWDLINNKSDGTSETPRYKNAWWQLTLGVRL